MTCCLLFLIKCLCHSPLPVWVVAVKESEGGEDTGAVSGSQGGTLITNSKFKT